VSFNDRCPSFDEVFDPEGALRHPYAELERRFGLDVLRPAGTTTARLRDRPLGDDARILPVPWALDEAEYSSVIHAGTSQRAQALQMFFADLVLGAQRFMASGTSLTRKRLQAILTSEGTSLARLRSLWKGHGREEIRFVYGPDLMRGPDGGWLLLEDNVGCVGGSADSYFVWSLYVDAAEDRNRSYPSYPPSESDLGVALRMWLAGLGLAAGDGGVVAMLGCEANGDELHSVLIQENARRRIILEQVGVEVVDSSQLHDRRVWAILNFHDQHELIGAFRRRTGLFNAPGTGMLGNKALLPHVDEMIRFFCDEEPLFPTPSTHVLEDGALPPGDWVIKSVRGCQGTDVFVLCDQPPERLDAIRRLVRDSRPKPGFVAQQRVEPSHLSTDGPGGWDTYLLELRLVAYVVGWSRVHVSSQPIGKAVSSFDVRRQHNVSQGACYVPVMVISEGSRR
jgi:uncharacterized circularly permuted ATP-grasp superfamily protein